MQPKKFYPGKEQGNARFNTSNMSKTELSAQFDATVEKELSVQQPRSLKSGEFEAKFLEMSSIIAA